MYYDHSTLNFSYSNFPQFQNCFQEKNEEDNVQYDCVESLNATPVCSGKVRGKARVVLDVAQAHLIQKGDILITRSTDIGWSPYFPLLGGVVTELGGLISHGI